MASSERIVVLVTKREKAAITSRAKSARLSTGEYMRRAATTYSPIEQQADVEGLIRQIEKTTSAASKALDSALAELAASNRRIAAMERRHASRRKKSAA